MALAGQLDGAHPIIDSNLIGRNLDIGGTSLVRELYDAHADKLLLVDDALTSAGLQDLNGLSYFFRRTQPYVLPEVILEVGALSKQLGVHYTFYRDRLGIDRKKWRNAEEEHFRGLDNLRNLSNRVFTFLREMQPFTYNVDWGSTIPKRWLDIARRRSKDLVKKGFYNQSRIKSPLGLGLNLETDQKLSALAFLIGNAEDVLLITKDKGLINLLWRLNHYLHVEFPQRVADPAFTPSGHGMQALDLNDEEIKDIPTSYAIEDSEVSRV